MNLCLAVILLDVAFLMGNKENFCGWGCKVTSFITQYFFLAVFTWCGVESFHSCRGVVKPLKEPIKRFIQKSLLFGWGKTASAIKFSQRLLEVRLSTIGPYNSQKNADLGPSL